MYNKMISVEFRIVSLSLLFLSVPPLSLVIGSFVSKSMFLQERTFAWDTSVDRQTGLSGLVYLSPPFIRIIQLSLKRAARMLSDEITCSPNLTSDC